MESYPLTAADLSAHTSLFGTQERLLELELTGLSGLQINEAAFARLTKPDPFYLFETGSGGETVLMLGTDQRDMQVPKLAEALQALPANAHVLDIGSGDGQTTSYALGGRSEPLFLLPLDPVEDSLTDYQELIGIRHPGVAIPRVLNTEIDAMIEAVAAEPGALPDRFDAVIAVHSIYFSSEPSRVLSFALDRLARGGRLLVVFAEDLGRYTGAMTFGYFAQHGLDPEGKVRTSQSALKELFGLTPQPPSTTTCQRSLRQALARDDLRVAEIERQPTRLYGHDLGDMIAMAFINVLGFAEDGNLARQIAYVSRRLRERPEDFDLRLHIGGPRARMFSVAQPQIYLAVEKL